MKVPCYKCEDREIGCHSVCGKYIEFAEYKRVEREKRYEDNAIRVSHNDHVKAVIEKINRRKQ